MDNALLSGAVDDAGGHFDDIADFLSPERVSGLLGEGLYLGFPGQVSQPVLPGLLDVFDYRFDIGQFQNL